MRIYLEFGKENSTCKRTIFFKIDKIMFLGANHNIYTNGEIKYAKFLSILLMMEKLIIHNIII